MPTYPYYCNEHGYGWTHPAGHCPKCRMRDTAMPKLARVQSPPNEGLLKGVSCPACGFAARFVIAATSHFVVMDDGIGDHGDVEWNDSSPIFCPRCHQKGTVAEFEAIVRTG